MMHTYHGQWTFVHAHKEMMVENGLFIRYCPLFGTIYLPISRGGGLSMGRRNKNNSWNQIILRIWFTCGKHLNKKARAAAVKANVTSCNGNCCWRNRANKQASKRSEKAPSMCVHGTDFCMRGFLYPNFCVFVCVYAHTRQYINTQSYTLMHSRVLLCCSMNEFSLPFYDFDHIYSALYIVFVLWRKEEKKWKNQQTWVSVPWKTDTILYIYV